MLKTEIKAQDSVLIVIKIVRMFYIEFINH